MSEQRGCEICGCSRVVWRGGAHVCGVCSALYDSWCLGFDPNQRPALTRFVAACAEEQAGGPLQAAKQRFARRVNDEVEGTK